MPETGDHIPAEALLIILSRRNKLLCIGAANFLSISSASFLTSVFSDQFLFSRILSVLCHAFIPQNSEASVYLAFMCIKSLSMPLFCLFLGVQRTTHSRKMLKCVKPEHAGGTGWSSCCFLPSQIIPRLSVTSSLTKSSWSEVWSSLGPDPSSKYLSICTVWPPVEIL